VPRDYLARVVPLVQERLKVLTESAELTDFFFVPRPSYEPALLVQRGVDTEKTRDGLRRVSQRVATTSPFDAATLEAAIRPLTDELGVKAGQLFGAVRVAVTGKTVAPPLFQTMEVLGQERCAERLQAALQALQSVRA
jgi:glutamyl-tRNA synthetase